MFIVLVIVQVVFFQHECVTHSDAPLPPKEQADLASTVLGKL
jgi:hypothetical protein